MRNRPLLPAFDSTFAGPSEILRYTRGPIPWAPTGEESSMTKPGSFVHIEIASTDPGKTRTFLEDVFGWKFESIPEMSYATYQAPTPPHGGLMSPMEGQPPGILNYVLSKDVDADLEKIQAAGGRVIVPKMEIPGIGWWAGFTDPTGIMLAVFQNKEMPRPAPRRRPAARRAVSRGRKGKAQKGKGRKGRR